MSEATYTADQIIERVKAMLSRRAFAEWHSEDGAFNDWMTDSESAPTTDEINQALKRMLKL